MTDPNWPQAVEPDVAIVVYVCPTAGCQNHYASPDFRPDRSNIASVTSTIERGETRPRIECPECRNRGIRVDRVGYIVTQYVSLDEVLKQSAKESEKTDEGEDQ